MILKEELKQMEEHLKNDVSMNSIKNRIEALKKAIRILQMQACV